MLAEVLRCEVRYLDKIVAEWNAFKLAKPSTNLTRTAIQFGTAVLQAKLVEKAITADAARATLPRKLCTACGQEKPITEFYEHGAQCKVCRRAKVTAYRETHPPKPKRKLPA